MVARYRGGGGSGAITGAESSIDSLDDDEDDESSSTPHSQTSFGTRDSVAAVGGTETLPCGGVMVADHAASPSQMAVSTTVNENNQQKTFHWTLSNYAQAARRRNNSGTVRVDLASPEDISLDESSRVVFSAYGTTV